MDQLFVSALFWSKVLQGSTRIPLPTTPTTVIIAPHPDDEVLCCSNKITEKIKAGEEVKVVIVTDGDAYTKKNHLASRAYGADRRKESQAAANRMGLSRNDLLFLGFPDGMLKYLGVTSLKSPYSGRVDTPSNAYVPNVAYTKTNLTNQIEKIIAAHKPYEIYIPSQRDLHPDHKLLGKLVKEIVHKREIETHIYEYVVHKRGKERETEEPDKEKLSLISIFRSQFHDTFHREFLEHFAYFQEQFFLTRK